MTFPRKTEVDFSLDVEITGAEAVDEDVRVEELARLIIRAEENQAHARERKDKTGGVLEPHVV